MADSIEQHERTLAALFPSLSPDLLATLARSGKPVRCRDGHQLFGPGHRAEAYLMLLAGTVRVEHMVESGRSVVLYRVSAGDSCVMTTSCLFSDQTFPAYGFAEEDVEAVAFPAPLFLSLVGESEEFRLMALKVFTRRILELVEVVDELLLHRVDLRLAGRLAEQARKDKQMNVTHQALAIELGTAREVVSRILKDFERRHWIALARGAITILEPAALAAFATGERQATPAIAATG